MTFVTILNVVLAVALIGGLLRLLSWAIISSPREPLAARVGKHPYARSHLPRASAGLSHQRVKPVTG